MHNKPFQIWKGLLCMYQSLWIPLIYIFAMEESLEANTYFIMRESYSIFTHTVPIVLFESCEFFDISYFSERIYLFQFSYKTKNLLNLLRRCVFFNIFFELSVVANLHIWL